MTLTIEKARSTDRQTVIALLKQEKLLTEDLPDDLPYFLIAKAGLWVG
ncbi:hypothetical protein [Dyadobacter arcticus]|uniref:GNAT family N-acetyltransferase n=1 Tax=Dyadobacter arcticus TaxID=1078754 RepID=A0ABX0URA8_9BACT|nr:hypothetical protein [Dyadobacter arcticus]NIJ55517.1 hypothetical protein [Dyadobacter arcticus]